MDRKHHYKITDILLSVIMILIAAYGIINGFKFGIILDGRPSTGFQPVFAGTILLVSSICLLVRSIKDGNKLYRELRVNPEKAREAEEKRQAEEAEAAEYRRDTESWLGKKAAALIPNAKIRWALISLVSLWLLIKIIDKLGMYFGLWLLNFAYLKFISKYSWFKSLLYSAIIAASFFIVFSLILDVNVPKFLNSFM